jgi:hypothetical protein
MDLNVAGLILQGVLILVALALFWSKQSDKIDALEIKISEGHKALENHHEVTREAIGGRELFQETIRAELEAVRAMREKQQNLCDNHTNQLTSIRGSIKGQEKDAGYMNLVLQEIKQMGSIQTEVVRNNTSVIERLLDKWDKKDG